MTCYNCVIACRLGLLAGGGAVGARVHHSLHLYPVAVREPCRVKLYVVVKAGRGVSRHMSGVYLYLYCTL